MRHNVLKTYDNKVAATTDQIPAAVTRIGLARPVDAGNLHLQIQTATEPDFSDAVTAIDTYANEADRDKVHQLWLIAGQDKPKSLGLLESGKAKIIALPTEAMAKMAEGAALAVSLEPPGGSKSPDGQSGPVISV